MPRRWRRASNTKLVIRPVRHLCKASCKLKRENIQRAQDACKREACYASRCVSAGVDGAGKDYSYGATAVKHRRGLLILLGVGQRATARSRRTPLEQDRAPFSSSRKHDGKDEPVASDVGGEVSGRVGSFTLFANCIRGNALSCTTRGGRAPESNRLNEWFVERARRDVPLLNGALPALHGREPDQRRSIDFLWRSTPTRSSRDDATTLTLAVPPAARAALSLHSAALKPTSTKSVATHQRATSHHAFLARSA